MNSLKRLFQFYAECEHSIWNYYVRRDTFTQNSAHLLCRVKIMKQFSIIAKKRPDTSAVMTVVAVLAAGAIAKLGVAAHLLQLTH